MALAARRASAHRVIKLGARRQRRRGNRAASQWNSGGGTTDVGAHPRRRSQTVGSGSRFGIGLRRSNLAGCRSRVIMPRVSIPAVELRTHVRATDLASSKRRYQIVDASWSTPSAESVDHFRTQRLSPPGTALDGQQRSPLSSPLAAPIDSWRLERLIASSRSLMHPTAAALSTPWAPPENRTLFERPLVNPRARRPTKVRGDAPIRNVGATGQRRMREVSKHYG